MLGNNLEVLIVRSSGFTWSGMDTYRDWSKKQQPVKHFNEHVLPLAKNIEHHLSVIDEANSHWGSKVEYGYVGVSSYEIKQAHQMAMEKDVKLFSDVAKSNNWPYNWSWQQSVGGKANISLAIAYQSWAAMAPPEHQACASS